MVEAVIAVALIGGTVLAWLVWRRGRLRPRAMKLFARDLVKHPDYHRQIDEEHEQLVRAMDEAAAAPPPPPAEFPGLIDDLLSHDRRRVDVARIHLEKVAAAAEPLLLAALDDPRATWTEDESTESAPAERLVRLLAAIPSRALGDRIGHLADHPNWHVHRLAIKARVALGRAADLPFVLGQLVVQTSEAQEGVELAIRRGWAEPAFIEGVSEWAERTALDPSRPFSYWAVQFYADNGGPAALEALRSPEILSVSNNRNVHAALDALNRHSVRLEPEIVRPLLDKAIASQQDWPWDCVFEPGIRALAVSDPAGASRLAEVYLENPENLRYHRVAVDFLRDSAGLPRPYAIEPPAGIELTDVERSLIDELLLCSIVYGQICNGRLSQYFFNSWSDDWPRHVQALRGIGFEEGAAAIEEASRLIHPAGASLDRGERIAQYAALSEGAERRLDQLSELFYSDAPQFRFMLRHKDLFTRVRRARLEAGMDD